MPQKPNPNVHLTTRLRHATCRWLRILGLSTIGALAFHLFLPWAWSWVGSLNPPYAPWFIKAATLTGTFLLFYLVLEPIRVRRGHWSTFVWYPPLWISPLLACALAAVMDHAVYICAHSIRPHWQQMDVLAPIFIVFLLAMLLRQVRRVPRPLPLSSTPRSQGVTTERMTKARSEDTWSWPQIRDWISGGEHTITTEQDDLFGRAPVAARIARAIQGGRSAALLGAFGTGKSSVLNLARAKMVQGTSTVIIANFDVWAVPRPEDVPRLALDQVVDALDHHVDTLGLRNLPTTYQRMVAALPVRNISTILGLQNQGDSLAELQRLTPLLEVLNARLVLIVEDVERTTPEFDTRHLQRLLWALRGLPRVSAVLACDPDNGPSIDFSKLCDTIELLRPMEYEHVGAILVTAINHWQQAYPDTDPRTDRHWSTLRLESHQAGGMHEYLRRIAPDTPLDHLMRLLLTPRCLRQVLRKVDSIWQQLHGEAHLEEIIVIAALRGAAPSVYEFLFSHIDAARHGPDELLGSSTTLRDDWNSLTATLPNGRAARGLVDLLHIPQLSQGHSHGGSALQGVHRSHPTDYFRRIEAEQLDPEELRDQTVLEDIDKWRQERAEPLVDSLLAGDEDGDRYPVVWLHFSGRHATSELAELASRVAERVLARDGRDASGDHAALLALRHACGQQLEREGDCEWLRTLIVRAAPVSLGFATELYSSWVGENGMVNTGARLQIRDALVRVVQETLRDGAGLAALLSPGNPWCVSRLVLCMAAGESGVALETWREQLAPELVRTARTDPEVILPELANLLGDTESSMTVPDSDPPTFVRRYAIDQRLAIGVLGDTLDDVLCLVAEYEGSNVYVVGAKEAARGWLRERLGEEG